MSLEGRIYVLKQAYSHSYATTVTGTCQGVLPFGRVGSSSWGCPARLCPHHLAAMLLMTVIPPHKQHQLAMHPLDRLEQARRSPRCQRQCPQQQQQHSVSLPGRLAWQAAGLGRSTTVAAAAATATLRWCM